ncbi:hypothetical protein OSH11_17160 [Kaistia dalseonensis]|uniref:Head-to-tail stopper n=1 Tax=Kaistia dalseonensis TaxID=410840 RepID=A0ABU0HBB3_9HYPH|nr:hypothetical protein [Kaistia dalseonensis]MCX5496439.1 hypothetical protein [Kaistia dalseonensis]MDQ0439060.1 hypothetical protein [Kaistia dalseonensis]
MIDFDRLILGPAMDAFARPIIVVPKSGAAPYGGRGDYREPHTDIQLEDGSFSTASPTIGIRRSEFARVPQQDDRVYIDVDGLTVIPNVSRLFLVADVKPDGEGDVKLILAEIDP